MPKPALSPYRVAFDDSFRVSKAPTEPPKADRGKDQRPRHEKELETQIERLDAYQRMLYAQNDYALLLVFQAMDAAGKDGTIRAVMSGVNPAGCQVSSFKKPSPLELDHDFLWRSAIRLPERGRIGIFNRSYYEEVLVVRVHPEYLTNQRLPHTPALEDLWEERFESIREHEQHLARNGTVILKFWLNVSPGEQRKRFLDRIEEADKNWKFEDADIEERQYWDDYMHAYEEALRATSRPWAPWFAIPADDKRYMRATVATIIADTLEGLDLRYPAVTDERRSQLHAMRDVLNGK